PRTPPWWSSWNWTASSTRTTSPPRPTRNSSPAPPAVTRCSSDWPVPPWTGSARRGCSRSNRWPMTEPAPICDQPGDLPVSHSRTVHQGAVFDLVSEQVDLGSACVVRREFLALPGAVALTALDGCGRAAMVHQYGHAARSCLGGMPAGVLYAPGDTRLAAVQRELAEEADLGAEDWLTLLDFYSPRGG